MCLAIPGKVVELLKDRQAIVDFMGVKKTVAVDLIDNLKKGDYVIVHAGFAINKLDRRQAREAIKEFETLLGDDKPVR
jgi:hydrogenase expression/formation protein HypC